MANVKGLTITRGELSQTIDLVEATGVDVTQSPELMRKIEQDIIDYIVDRTHAGKGIGGKDWSASAYSQSYKDSLAFKAGGKGDTVDLDLTGDMLGSLDVLKESGGQIKIGIADESQLDKAYGHQTGFKGHPTIPQGKYKREFLGITQGELKDILAEYKAEINDLKTSEPRARVVDDQARLINAIRVSDLFGGNDEG